MNPALTYGVGGALLYPAGQRAGHLALNIISVIRSLRGIVTWDWHVGLLRGIVGSDNRRAA